MTEIKPVRKPRPSLEALLVDGVPPPAAAEETPPAVSTAAETPPPPPPSTLGDLPPRPEPQPDAQVNLKPKRPTRIETDPGAVVASYEARVAANLSGLSTPLPASLSPSSPSPYAGLLGATQPEAPIKEPRYGSSRR